MAGDHESVQENEPARGRIPRRSCLSHSSRLQSVRREARSIFKLAWPTALASFLEQFTFTISLFFVGHIDGYADLALESTGLAVSIINVTAFSVAIGMSTAIDTLGSQAYGAKNYRKVGVMLQRGICALALILVLIYALWANIESLLHILHQPPCAIELTKQYIQIYMAAVPALYLFIVLQKYLQVQNIVLPFIATALTMNITSAILHYLFIYVANMGVRGAALAVVIALYSSLFLLILIIIAFKLYKKTWFGWSRDCLNGWWEFVRYGVPGLVMICFEWWSFEIGYLITGVSENGKLQQDIHAILITLLTILFMIPFSIGIAVNIRVGNELGAGNPRGARLSFLVGCIFIGVWITVVQILFYSLREYIPRLYTDEPCVLEHIGKVAIFLAGPSMLFDQIQGFLAGAIKGLGKQLYAAIVNFVCYFIVGIPLGSVLAIPEEMGAVGYWIGLCVAVSSQAILYFLIVVCSNWKKESDKARKTAGVVVISEDSVKPQNDIEMITLLSNGTEASDESGTLESGTLESDFTSTTANCVDSNVQGLPPNEEGYLEDDNLLVPNSQNIETDLEESEAITYKSNADVKTSNADNGVANCQGIHLSRRTIISRIIVTGIALLILITAVTISQLFVYKREVCIDSSFNSTNSTHCTTS